MYKLKSSRTRFANYEKFAWIEIQNLRTKLDEIKVEEQTKENKKKASA